MWSRTDWRFRGAPADVSLICFAVQGCLLLACCFALRSFMAEDAVGRAWSGGAVGLIVGAGIGLSLLLSAVGLAMGLTSRSVSGVVALAGNAASFLVAGVMLFGGLLWTGF